MKNSLNRVFSMVEIFAVACKNYLGAREVSGEGKNHIKLKDHLLMVLLLSLFIFQHALVAAQDPSDSEEGRFSIELDNRFLARASANYQLSPHSPDLMGENFDINTGSVNFSRIDGALPGNSSLEVAYRTSFKIQQPNKRGWNEDLPRIELDYVYLPEGWKNGNYCSGSQHQLRLSGRYTIGSRKRTKYYPASLYTPGTKIIVPGKINEKLMKNDRGSDFGLDPGTYSYVTKSKWRVSCFINDAGNEGFKATSPQGLSYYFDILMESHISNATIKILESKYHKKRAVLMASKSEDRFGNDVVYRYASPSQLISMTSNDGRTLTVTRQGNVTTLTSNGRVWKYTSQVDVGGVRGIEHLTVERPDGKTWQYNLFHTRSGGSDGDDVDPCGTEDNYPLSTRRIMTVTHPDGTTGAFTFDNREEGRVHVPRLRILTRGPGVPYDILAPVQMCSYVFSLIEKKLSGPGYDNATWYYRYSNGHGFYAGTTVSGGELVGPLPANIDPSLFKSTTIVQPDYSSVKYYINKDARSPTENTIEAIEYFAPPVDPIFPVDRFVVGDLIKQSKKYYSEGTVYGRYISHNYSNPLLDLQNPKLTQQEIVQNGDTYTTVFSNFDIYDVPNDTNEYNSYSNKTRYRQTDFYHDTFNWLLNLPRVSKAGSTPADLISYRENTYYPETHHYKSLPHEVKVMDVWQSKAEQYHADGNLKKIVYNGTKRYEIFDDYKLGQAQKITLPCSRTRECSTANGSTNDTIITQVTINDHGWLQNTTDFKGNVVNYQYNAMGLLTLIDPADPAIANTTISYQTIAANDDGIAGSGALAGMYKQTITQGNYEKRLYHDSMLRPLFTREMDITDAATTRYSRATFDYQNRPTFTSFASASVAAVAGIDTEYDALGRVKKVTRNTDGSATATQYLANNVVRATDPKGNETRTQYLAFGSPSQSQPLVVNAAENVTTTIDYNTLGNTTRISQGGITEHHYYDSLQQLCRTHRPETGSTAYAYNERRQMIWYAEGASGLTNSCDSASIPNNQKVYIGYNELGERDSVNYPDATPNLSYGYDENGEINRLSAGSSVWTYDHDSAGNLLHEQLTLDGKDFSIDYFYNDLGHVHQIVYPSRREVDLRPNALGQATIAATFASNVSYYANGQVKTLTYGNGIERNIALDSTGRINAITDTNGATSIMALDLSYDAMDNIDSLIDGVDSRYNLSGFYYDGLNRLTNVEGKWGLAGFYYDALGNLSEKTQGTDSITYHYDVKNRLSSISGSHNYSYGYDTRGNINNNGRYRLSFNRANQMTAAKGILYQYDGHNRRVKQTKADGTHYTVYNQAGQLLYRLKPNGDQIDTIYLGKHTVAEVTRVTE